MVYMLGFILRSKSLSDILLAWWTGGVTCRNLSGLNLDGEISPAIGDLKNLLSMYGIFNFRFLSLAAVLFSSVLLAHVLEMLTSVMLT